MANVDIKLGYKDSAWFTANATLVLKVGQIVYLEQTGTYKIGDGITQLSSLTFLGGGGTVDVNTIGAAINGATSATPNDTDLVMSVESSVAKKNTWTQIKAFLKTYFDGVYTTTSAVASQITSALSSYVPYTNATQDTDLGNYSLNAKSLHVKGTAGAGHLGLKHQSSNITANASESSLGADSSGNPVWKNDGNAIDSLELQSNKTSTVTGNESSTSKYLTVKGVYDWATGLFVKKGTLTANYIPKATASDTIGDSNISDNGTTVNISVTNSQIVASGTSSYINFDNGVKTGYLQNSATSTIISHTDLIELSSTNVNVSNLTASKIVQTDASKNLTSSSYAVSDLALKSNTTLSNYLEIPEQSKPSTPTNAFRLYADTSNRLSWIGENGYVRTFDGTANTADRVYTLPDVAGTLPVGTGTANQITYWSAANTISTLSTATYPSLVELSYAKGVTSAIQTQLDGKLSSTKERLLVTTSSSALSPADATIYYFGTFSFNPATTTASISRFQFPENATITKVIIMIRVGGNPSNESVSFYLRASGTTDTTITTSLDMSLVGANSSKTYVYTPTPFSVTSGTEYENKILTPTWATNPVNMNVSINYYGY